MPAPPVKPGSPLGAEHAVKSREDVLAVFPPEMKREESAPVRDAIADSLLELLHTCQDADTYGADQANVHLATDQYQDGLGEDRGLHRAPGETNDAYRERVLAVPAVVTHDAIREAVNAILAPWTPVKCQIFDAVLDRWFVHKDASAPGVSWHSFVKQYVDVLGNTNPPVGPNYPSRFFERDGPNNGGNSLPGNDPQGAWIFKDHVTEIEDGLGNVVHTKMGGRRFVLRVPDLSPLNKTPAVMYFSVLDPLGNEIGGVGKPFGFYVGGAPKAAAYVSKGTKIALDVYTAIVAKVNAIVGHSVRWMMVSDARMT